MKTKPNILIQRLAVRTDSFTKSLLSTYNHKNASLREVLEINDAHFPHFIAEAASPEWTVTQSHIAAQQRLDQTPSRLLLLLQACLVAQGVFACTHWPLGPSPYSHGHHLFILLSRPISWNSHTTREQLCAHNGLGPSDIQSLALGLGAQVSVSLNTGLRVTHWEGTCGSACVVSVSEA